jgi:hypothetical protein
VRCTLNIKGWVWGITPVNAAPVKVINRNIMVQAVQVKNMTLFHKKKPAGVT